MMAPKNITSKKLPQEYIDIKETVRLMRCDVSKLGAMVAQGRATQEQKDNAIKCLTDAEYKLEIMWKSI